MATVGIFAMNLSPRSGGVYRLVEGLVSHAGLSRHQLVYLRERDDRSASTVPSAVELHEGSTLGRQAFQAMLAAPWADIPLSQRLLSRALIAGLLKLSGIRSGVLDEVDLWLWPHCFRPVPNLGGHVAISHDMIHRRLPELFGRGAHRCRARSEGMLAHTRLVLTPSLSSASDLISVYPELEPRIRPFNAAPPQSMPDADPALVEAIRREYGNVPILLYVAVDWPHKNHRLLIDVAKRLRRQNTPAKIVLAGNRRGDAIRRLIHQAGVSDIVIDEKHVSVERLAALYRAASVFLFPSRCEGFGLPLVEAMQMRLPIVAAESPCIQEVLGGAGQLIGPDDVEAWVDTLTQLIRDPQSHAAWAVKAWDRRTSYTWDRTWSSLDAIFDEAAMTDSMPAISQA